VIRPARPEDVEAMAALGPGWSAAQVAEELSNPDARVLVLECAGRVAGQAIGWAIAGETQVLEIAVAPQARRRGHGRRLLEALCQACGGGPALLEVRASNVAGLALYERAGFQRVGRRARYYADGEEAILMTRTQDLGTGVSTR